MGILLAFAPFIVFAVLAHFTSAPISLAAGTAVAATLVARDYLRTQRSPKILEVGTFVLFAALTLFTWLHESALTIIAVRVCVDAGLLLIVLLSMLVGRPFTLQYAKEKVAPEQWNTPRFKRTNYVLTCAWAAAFAIIVLADLVLMFEPQMPRRFGVIAIALALTGAFKFTQWYPDHVRGP